MAKEAFPEFQVGKLAREKGSTGSTFPRCPPPERELSSLDVYRDAEALKARRLQLLDAGQLREEIRVAPERLVLRLEKTAAPAPKMADLDIRIELLEADVNPIAVVEKSMRARGCTADKAGAAMFQWKKQWVQVVSRCATSKEFPAQLSALMKALKRVDPAAAAPSRMVFAPCGQVALTVVVVR